MKKLLIIAIITFNAITIFAQTQKYDIMSYTPPKGWEATNGENAKVYTKIDKAKNTLGIIMLYPSINSSGDAQDDFKYVWKQIVQDSFGASANPEIETDELKGFTVVNGGELIKYEGIQALAMLTVLSGEGKVISVLTITNDQSYVQSTQAIIESLNIEVKQSARTQTQKNQPMEKTTSASELEGVWTDNSNFYGQNVSEFGSFVSDASVGSGFRLELIGGKFKEGFGFVNSNKLLTTNETGSYRIEGNRIVISNLSMRTKIWDGKTYKLRTDEKSNPPNKTYVFKIYDGDSPGSKIMDVWDSLGEFSANPDNPSRRFYRN